MALSIVDPEPEPGDLIEIIHDSFTHWVVYVGGGEVVHLTGVGTGFPGINVAHFALGNDTRGVVRKELLTTVAVGSKYKVKNKYDETKQPLCAEEIVQRAEAQVGKEVPYNFKKYNCEHFATELRYEVPLSDQNRDGPQPKPGDLIEISHLVHKHWAVYVGGGYVIHLTRIGKLLGILSSVFGLSIQGNIKKEPLSKVAAGDKFRVNNKRDHELQSFSPALIIQQAEALVGESPYDIFNWNCEHFANKVRYGVSISDQVSETIQTITRFTALLEPVVLASGIMLFLISRKIAVRLR